MDQGDGRSAALFRDNEMKTGDALAANVLAVPFARELARCAAGTGRRRRCAGRCSGTAALSTGHPAAADGEQEAEKKYSDIDVASHRASRCFYQLKIHSSFAAGSHASTGHGKI